MEWSPDGGREMASLWPRLNIPKAFVRKESRCTRGGSGGRAEKLKGRGSNRTNPSRSNTQAVRPTAQRHGRRSIPATVVLKVGESLLEYSSFSKLEADLRILRFRISETVRRKGSGRR